jgi:hypothetical protein
LQAIQNHFEQKNCAVGTEAVRPWTREVQATLIVSQWSWTGSFRISVMPVRQSMNLLFGRADS